MKNKILLSSYYFDTDNIDSYLSGPSVDLVNYLNEKGYEIYYFRYPLINSKKKKKFIIQKIYRSKTKTLKIIEFENKHISSRSFYKLIPTILYKLREFLIILYHANKLKKKVEIIWCTESISLLAFFFSSLKSKKNLIIYDVIDFSPRRFKNKFHNFLFHLLDLISCNLSDLIMCQTDRIIKFRNKKYKNKFFNKQIIKKSGIEEKFIVKNLSDFQKNKFVFCGVISEENGVEEIIDAIQLFKNKKNLFVDIYGIGDEKYLDYLDKKINNLNLKNNIKINGPLLDKNDLTKIISNYELAFALYPKIKSIISTKFYGSVNKVPMYFSASLPVITTKYIRIAKEIDDNNLGVICGFSKEKIYASLQKFINLNDEKKIEIRNNCYNYSLENTWEKVFDQIFKTINNELSNKI